MKIKETSGDVFTSTGDILKAEINTEHHFIFEALRSKLYQNKETWLQEILSNAYDAHVEVGKGNVPIWVRLPRINDLFLKVKDEGPGISPQLFQNVYLNLAFSTKRGDNNQLGGFGIGSCSPLSYTDTFYLNTTYEGIHYKWCIFIGEDKKNAATLLSKQPTEEPNGTEVVVPIKSADISAFKLALLKFCEFWKVKPNVDSETGIFAWTNRKHFETDRWMLGSWPGMIALVGQIPYSVDANLLGHNPSHLFSGTAFKFDIGELDLVISRESLEYTENTKQKIVDRIAELKRNLVPELSKEVEKLPSVREAYSYIDNFQDNLSNALLKGVFGFVKYKSIKISNAVTIPECPLPIFVVYKKSWKSKKVTREEVTAINLSSPIIFNDGGKKVGFSLDEVFDKLKTKFYFINTDKEVTYEDLVENVPLFAEGKLELLRLSNYCSFATTSKGKSVYAPKPKGTLLAYKIHLSSANAAGGIGSSGILPYLSKEYIDLDGEPAVYTILEGVNHSNTGLAEGIGPYRNPFVLEFLGVLKYLSKPVYAIRKSNKDSIPNSWIPLNEQLQKDIVFEAAAIDSSVDLHKLNAYLKFLAFVRKQDRFHQAYWAARFFNIPIEEPCQQILDYKGQGSLARALALVEDIRSIDKLNPRLLKLAGLYTGDNSEIFSFVEDTFCRVSKDYPLLNLLFYNSTTSGEVKKQILRYIKLEDNALRNNS